MNLDLAMPAFEKARSEMIKRRLEETVGYDIDDEGYEDEEAFGVTDDGDDLEDDAEQDWDGDDDDNYLLRADDKGSQVLRYSSSSNPLLQQYDRIINNITSLGFSSTHVHRALTDLNPEISVCSEMSFLHVLLDKLVSEAAYDSMVGVDHGPRLSEFKLVSKDFVWPVMEMAEYEFGLGSINKVNFDNVLVITNLPVVSEGKVGVVYEILASLMFSQIGPVRDVFIPKDITQDVSVMKGHAFVEFESSASSLMACRCVDEFSFSNWTLKARMFRHYRQITTDNDSKVEPFLSPKSPRLLLEKLHDITTEIQSTSSPRMEDYKSCDSDSSFVYQDSSNLQGSTLDFPRPRTPRTPRGGSGSVDGQSIKLEGPVELMRRLNQEKNLAASLHDKLKKVDDERCLVLGENRLLLSKTVALEDTLDELEVALRRSDSQRIGAESRALNLERDNELLRETTSHALAESEREVAVLRRKFRNMQDTFNHGDRATSESKLCDRPHVPTKIQDSIIQICDRLEREGDDLQLLSFDEIAALEVRLESACKVVRRAKEIVKEKEDKERHNKNEERMCVVCLESQKSVLLLPCRHLCLCGECSSRPEVTKCPICRQTIFEKLVVYA